MHLGSCTNPLGKIYWPNQSIPTTHFFDQEVLKGVSLFNYLTVPDKDSPRTSAAYWIYIM